VIDQHLDRVLERAFLIGPATFGVVQAQAGARKVHGALTDSIRLESW
jgi:hypothetical protein